MSNQILEKWYGLSCIDDTQRKSDSLSHSDALAWKQREWKRGLWSQLCGILVQKPNLNDLSFPVFEGEKCYLPTASVWAALVEYLGRAAARSTTAGCEALVPIFSLCRETVHTKGRGSTTVSGLRRSYVGLSEFEQSAWDIFETQMHFVTQEKNGWEVMATHEN